MTDYPKNKTYFNLAHLLLLLKRNLPELSTFVLEKPHKSMEDSLILEQDKEPLLKEAIEKLKECLYREDLKKLCLNWESKWLIDLCLQFEKKPNGIKKQLKILQKIIKLFQL